MTGIEEQYIDDAQRRAEELRECPKCHSENVMLHSRVSNFFFVVKCRDCGMSGRAFDTEDEAVEDWNTRADDKLMDDMAKYVELVAHRYSHPPIDNEVAAEARSVLTRIRERRT